jgi:threonine aldolase
MRFQSVQLDAYLTDGLWLRMATNANAMMSRLATGLVELGVPLIAEPEVNMAYAIVDEAVADNLEVGGLDFYRMGDDTIRLVTSFQTTTEDVDRALKIVASAVD